MVAKFSPPPAPQITRSSTHQSCLNMFFSMASLPQTLDKPTVMWASDKDIPRYPGLYISPNATTLPSTAPDNLPKHVGCLPLPWPWLFMRHANQLHYWTALTPRQSQYVGLLEPLSGLKVVQGPGRKWRLENVAEWRNLEAFMRKLLASMHRSFPLGSRTPLLVQVYGYDCSWSLRKQARSYLSIVQGVFVINVAKLTYAGHLLPKHWVEALLEQKLISLDEANMAGTYCQCHRRSSDSTLENLTEVINKFKIAAISGHPWSAKYLPSAIKLNASCQGPAARLASGGWGEEIEEVQSTADLQSLSDWGPANASSSSLAVPSSSAWGPTLAQSLSSAWATGSMGESPLASSSANNVSQLPGPLHLSALGQGFVTDQAPGKTPQQFFARIDASKAAKLAKMSPAENARVQAKERLHAALELPNKSRGCRVFKWSEDSSGTWIRTFLGRKNWHDAWANSAVLQCRTHTFIPVLSLLHPVVCVLAHLSVALNLLVIALDLLDVALYLLLALAHLDVGRAHHNLGLALLDVTLAPLEHCRPSCLLAPCNLISSHSQVPLPVEPHPRLCPDLILPTALTQRYGIIEHTAQATYMNPETLLPDKKIYVMMGVYNETVLPQYSTPMRDFFTYLTSPPNEFVTPPPTLTDLAPGTTRGFPCHCRRDLIVQTVLDNRGCPWYFVYARDPRDNNVPFSLCLSDPVSVNHLLRSEVSSLMFDVTHTLLSWGVPFNTLQPIADPRMLWASPPMPMYFNQVPLGLGMVEHKHKFRLNNTRHMLLSVMTSSQAFRDVLLCYGAACCSDWRATLMQTIQRYARVQVYLQCEITIVCWVAGTTGCDLWGVQSQAGICQRGTVMYCILVMVANCMDMVEIWDDPRLLECRKQAILCQPSPGNTQGHYAAQDCPRVAQDFES
ncbi:hypothetical protein BC835DRAFT_1305792 [Cytidiella melzeri]|nr:hypothetical protein BC835DRAFT_1305792 [Cytidiella melzeri]